MKIPVAVRYFLVAVLGISAGVSGSPWLYVACAAFVLGGVIQEAERA